MTGMECGMPMPEFPKCSGLYRLAKNLHDRVLELPPIRILPVDFVSPDIRISHAPSPGAAPPAPHSWYARSTDQAMRPLA